MGLALVPMQALFSGLFPVVAALMDSMARARAAPGGVSFRDLAIGIRQGWRTLGGLQPAVCPLTHNPARPILRQVLVARALAVPPPVGGGRNV